MYLNARRADGGRCTEVEPVGSESIPASVQDKDEWGGCGWICWKLRGPMLFVQCEPSVNETPIFPAPGKRGEIIGRADFILYRTTRRDDAPLYSEAWRFMSKEIILRSVHGQSVLKRIRTLWAASAPTRASSVFCFISIQNAVPIQLYYHFKIS